MMFCPSCGRQVSDEARFCPGCGRSLEPSAPRPPEASRHARARRAALAAGLVAAIVALVAAVALLVPRLLSDSPELQDRTSSNAATGGRATAADGYCYFYDDAASSIDRMRMDGSPAADAETVYALDEGHVAHSLCVKGGVLYFVDQDIDAATSGEGGSTLHALDLDGGGDRILYTALNAPDDMNNGATLTTACVFDRTLYVVESVPTGDYDFFCQLVTMGLDGSDQRVVCQLPTNTYASLVTRDAIYYVVDSSIYAVDPSTAQTRLVYQASCDYLGGPMGISDGRLVFTETDYGSNADASYADNVDRLVTVGVDGSDPTVLLTTEGIDSFNLVGTANGAAYLQDYEATESEDDLTGWVDLTITNWKLRSVPLDGGDATILLDGRTTQSAQLVDLGDGWVAVTDHDGVTTLSVDGS